MIGRLKLFLQRQDSLERTLFWVFLVIVLVASVASTIFTIYEQISLITSAVCLLTSVVCAVLAFKSLTFLDVWIVENIIST